VDDLRARGEAEREFANPLRGRVLRRFRPSLKGTNGAIDHSSGRSRAVLWTILVILAIVALALFIFSRVRGGRRL
jgi:hypothetical protein